jgi:carboxylesterase
VRSRCGPTPSPRADAAAPDAGGFALPGSRSLGCLLLHGFTATPAEVRSLGEALAAAGFPVRAVRLAGHATTPDDLARTGWPDWLASAEAGCAALRAAVPRVAVAGVSMGALLALLMAARDGRDLAAVVCCATPLRLADRRTALLHRLRWLPGLRRRYAVLPKRARDISDPVARAASVSYDVMPLPAVLSLLDLRRIVLRELARVTQPVLVLHGRHDHAAPVSNLPLLQRRLGSALVEGHVLEHSWHVVTEDVERDEVARLTIAFLDRIEGSQSRAR